MAAFELNKGPNHTEPLTAAGNHLDPRRLREECIIAFKVYDSCRQQDCLTSNEIGPARAAENICIGGEHIKDGDVIDPPDEAGRTKTLIFVIIQNCIDSFVS